MEFDHRMRGDSTTAAAATHSALTPGKRTLTEGLAVQRREAAPSSAGLAGSGTAAFAASGLSVPANRGQRPTLQMLFGVQRAATAAPAEDPAQVHAAAARGTATAASKLPYADQIQRAFGRHNVSGIQAHAGPDAAATAREMGARAYATGDHIVLGEGADLHTVAHEAAHVVQQRGGVQLKGGVGEVGDAYERHADDVADRVVRGESASALLDEMTGATDHRSRAPASGAVQHIRTFSEEIDQATKHLIERVLDADPVLKAMWQWVASHPTIHLRIVKSDGFASVEAPLGAKEIYLRIRPEKAQEQGGGALLGNLSHELTLHMLPWARPMMAQEMAQNGHDKDGFASKVLAPIAPNTHVLRRELHADIENKTTTTWGGNHSDLALWASHLRTVLGVAAHEGNRVQATLIVSTAIAKMVLPMLATGKPEDTVDRGGYAFGQFKAALTQVLQYQGDIADTEERSQFVANVEKIRARGLEYELYSPRTFEQWFSKVKALFFAEYRTDITDHPDHEYQQAFEDEISPGRFYDEHLANGKALTGPPQQGLLW